MPANKKSQSDVAPRSGAPEMPEPATKAHSFLDAGYLVEVPDNWTRDQVGAYGRACYLAGIADARACVPDRRNGPHYDSGVADRAHEYNKAVDETLTNLTALEQEAKK